MDTNSDAELAGETSGRLGQASVLVKACLEQPAATSRALQLLLDADADNEVVGAAVSLADSVSRLYAARQGADQDLAASLADAAAKMLSTERVDDASELLALAVRLGADGDTIAGLTGEVSSRITNAMREAMTAGDDAAGEKYADVLKSLVPGNAEAWLISGRLKLKQGLADDARQDLEKAVDLSPQSQNTLLNYARAQAGSGQSQEAVLTLFKLLRIADGSDGRYRPLARAELDTVFNTLAQSAARAQNRGDVAGLLYAINLMEEIADGVSGSMIEYVAGAKNCVRTAVGYSRAALAAGRGRRGLAACEAAMEIDSDSAALWSTIARLRLHYNENAQAVQAFKQSLDLEGDQASMRDGLAEALFRDGQIDAALAEAESAVAAASGNKTIADRKERIARAKAAVGATRSGDGGVRHIAVLGMPNQGNARLACQIADAAGGAFIGESFWLAGQPSGDDGAAKFSYCQTCRRPDCEVFGLDYRTSLSAAAGNWYSGIAERSGRGLLVSSDNSAHIVRRHDPALSCDAVIAYRSPASTWALLKEHYARQRRELPELLQFLGTWYRTYASAVYEFPQQGTRIAINLDEAVGNGAAQIETALLGLGLDRAGGEAPDQHFFGVNASEVTSDFVSTAELVEDLPVAETSTIVAYADAEELYRHLQSL